VSGQTPALIDVLAARQGIVCAVGAGGKKSLLYRLLAEHPGRAALTATVHTNEFPEELRVERIVDEEATLHERVLGANAAASVAYACPSQKPGRHAGVSATMIRSIHTDGGFEVTFVKADGARMRWIKAPQGDEPQVVPGTELVIPVVSARAIGEVLSERVAHRVQRVEAVTGVPAGGTLTPEAVGRLLASEQGALCRSNGARVVPVINMVDNDEQEEKARATAQAALAITKRFDRVLLCCLKRADAPLVAVVDR
jgi:probable selenium-dependent hydroxylase accessory protein YqeC